MSVFLDTTGQPTLAIGICDRCKTKRELAKLIPDGNSPGLRVCAPWVTDGCHDVFDPYRLPARQPDKLNLPYARPDEPLTVL